MAKPPKGAHEPKKLHLNNQIIAILTFASAILILSLTFVPGESLWNATHTLLLGLFGISSILWAILLAVIAINSAKEKSTQHIKVKIALSIVTIVLFCTALFVFFQFNTVSMLGFWDQLTTLYKKGAANFGTGLLGGLLGIPFARIFGITGAKIISVILLFTCTMILTRTTLLDFFRAIKKPMDSIKTSRNIYHERKIEHNMKKTPIDIPLGATLDQPDTNSKHKLSNKEKLASDKLINLTKEMNCSTINDSLLNATRVFEQKNMSNSSLDIAYQQNKVEGYTFPPLDFLEQTTESNKDDVTNELRTNGQMLVDTLKSFNVQTKVINICRGPTVTRYELQPAAGVKISRITNLADDIALNLAAAGVRIEAPIPGKAAVGIEIPNKITSVVRMRNLVSSQIFASAKSNITVVLGNDIAGNIRVTDLAKMPHLLIAGSTGSGKSVCINSIIISLLYKSTPDQVKLLLIDPKVVELGIYNGIPHLLIPVVTDPKKAAGALNWAVSEMLNRYKIFAEHNVRDLSSYNKIISSKIQKGSTMDENGEQLKLIPQIVIIIDELADLMMIAPNEVEDSICRLAQMARAAGMSLVIATQRPSVDVITGIIKANIPSRISLAVSSQVDSRTILDMAGAEKLLGRGDMLFSPIGSPKPIRIQGCYVTDDEIERITQYVKRSEEASYDADIINEIEKNAAQDLSGQDSNLSDDRDPMLNDAIKCIVETQHASTSMLQRKLRLGYARASRMIDEMEQMGIVGPRDGSRPRNVLITQQQWMEMSLQQNDQ